MAGVGPRGQPGHDVELPQQAAHDLIGIVGGAQAIELRHHFRERFFDIHHGALGIVLTLLIETALALDEFFAIEAGTGMTGRLPERDRIGQKAGNPLPLNFHAADWIQSSHASAAVSTRGNPGKASP